MRILLLIFLLSGNAKAVDAVDKTLGPVQAVERAFIADATSCVHNLQNPNGIFGVPQWICEVSQGKAFRHSILTSARVMFAQTYEIADGGKVEVRVEGVTDSHRPIPNAYAVKIWYANGPNRSARRFDRATAVDLIQRIHRDTPADRWIVTGFAFP